MVLLIVSSFLKYQILIYSRVIFVTVGALGKTALGKDGLQLFLDTVQPVNASLVGLKFSGDRPEQLLANLSQGARRRLVHLTIDQRLYASYSDEINAFAFEAGKTVTIIRDGDANKDGLFDSTDLVQVFQAGEYEDDMPQNSYWTTGDWTGNGEFDSSDLVAAFLTGRYEAEAAVVAVPEPSAMVLLLFGLIALRRSKRRDR